MKKVELLSPAGDLEKLKIAVLNGADAVYMAGKKFGARAFSKNFDDDEIIQAINYCHLYGVKLYVTINTIIYDEEVSEFIKYVEFLHKNKVDAVIVQDLGMADLIHKQFPNLNLHASTQMNIHSIEGLKFLKSIGFTRVVLAREVPLQLIKKMKKEVDIELEVFSHGALCISCSGNCYYSYFEMNRSANRGTCAQLCRQPYHLYDGNKILDIKDKYLLSPKDLCTVEKLNELIDAGIDSLKIEGRMKSKEYVGIVTRVYRNKIDYNKVDENDILDMKKVFNRDFTLGNLYNKKGKDFINGYRPNNMGVLLGNVIGYNKGRVKIKLCNDVCQNDAIRFICNEEEIGFYLNKIYKNNLLVSSALKDEIIEVECKNKINIATKVYKTIDSKLNDFIISSSNRKVKLNGEFTVENHNIIFEVTDYINKEKIILENVVYESKNKPTTNEDIREKLNKLGNEIYVFDNLKINVPNNIFIPISIINNLRRDIIELISKSRLNINNNYKCNKYTFNKINIDLSNDIFFEVKNENQLIYILNNTNYKVYVEDYELYNKYKSCDRIIYKLPRFSINNLDSNILVGDIDNINKNRFTDVYLNVVNSYYVRFLHEKGVKKVTLSFELDFDKIKTLVNDYRNRYTDEANLEVIIYGKPEIMISKYNILNTYLNNSNNNDYYLVDKYNKKFPLKVSNNYMRILNHKNINYLNDISRLRSIGINNFRIILNDETINDIDIIINCLKNN